MLKNSRSATLEDIEALAEGVLLGRIELKEFKDFSIDDITTNPRIIHIYNFADIPSLPDFFKLGSKRMKLRNYGKNSERILKAAVEEYLSQNIDSINATEIDEGLEIGHTKLVEGLQNGDRAEQVITPRIWTAVCDELAGTEFENRKILPTAAELDMKWPMAARSPLSSKAIKDYLAYSLRELRQLRGFGCKKVAVYAACTLHLHKQM